MFYSPFENRSIQATDTGLLDHVLKCEVAWPPPAIPLELAWEEKNDQELVEIIQRGNRVQRKKAFEAVYNRYYENVWRYIKSKVFCDDQTKDIFGAVWAIAVSDLPTKFTWQNKPIIAWLIRIADYKIYELIRQEQKSKSTESLERLCRFLKIESELSVSEEEPVAQIIRNEDAALLMMALKRLKSVKQRKIVRYRYWTGMKYKGIAKELKTTYDSVRQEHQRALKELERILGGLEENNG